MMKSVLILDEFFAMTAKIRTLFLSHIKITNYLTLKHGTFNLRRYEVNVQDNKVDINVYDVTYTTTETDSVYGIELKFDRVYRPSRKGSFTIFLNEHMVDLKRPVEVVVNGQKVFADKLTLSTANLQQSLSAFYDPERIFPAAVRVELK